MAKHPPKSGPTTPITEREDLAQEVAKRQRVTLAALQVHFGDRPWGGERQTPDEQLANYREVRDNPAFWQDAVQRATDVLKLSPDRLPRAVVEEAMKFEEKHKENGGG